MCFSCALCAFCIVCIVCIVHCVHCVHCVLCLVHMMYLELLLSFHEITFLFLDYISVGQQNQEYLLTNKYSGHKKTSKISHFQTFPTKQSLTVINFIAASILIQLHMLHCHPTDIHSLLFPNCLFKWEFERALL